MAIRQMNRGWGFCCSWKEAQILLVNALMQREDHGLLGKSLVTGSYPDNEIK